MTKLYPTLVALMAAGFVSGHAMALTKAEYDAEKARVEATYKADKEQCKSLAGNAKDVCEKEAKGKEHVAKAELKAQHEPTPRNQEKAREARADADYDVAKEKCDDLSGDAKSACKKDAKAAHTSAVKAAKGK